MNYNESMGHMEFLAGSALIALGIAALFYSLGIISVVVYSIVWWGLIFALDEVNYRRWGSSIIRNDWKRFFGVLLPISTLYWLYFDFLNILYPHWYYVGVAVGTPTLVLLSIVSFGTVIPIIVELFWLLNGPVAQFPFSQARLDFIRQYRFGVIAAGIGCLLLPFFNTEPISNQLMWLGPFLILLPFIISGEPANEKKFVRRFWSLLILAGLASGFLWESLNYWAGGKWKYIILPDTMHIFEMPLYGYVGFVPFAVSTVALYIFARKFIPVRLSVGIALYAFAFLASYAFVIISQ